jgi:hypothetical protein
MKRAWLIFGVRTWKLIKTCKGLRTMEMLPWTSKLHMKQLSVFRLVFDFLIIWYILRLFYIWWLDLVVR